MISLQKCWPAAGVWALCACSGASAPPIDETPAPIDPAPAVLHRLTTAQYASTIRDLFGETIVLPVALEPDVVERGLISIGASITTISPWGVEQYEAAAYDIAEQVIASEALRAAYIPCATEDDACAEQFIRTAGKKIWRRPPSEDDVTELVTIARAASAVTGSFHGGLEFALAAILQSPNFLFRNELGTPDPERPGLLRYDGWELASRLSFFLWNTTPDDELLAAAERGDLEDEAGLAAQVNRLLDSPRARAGVRNFFNELFELYRLDQLAKDPTIFTHYTIELGATAREETLRNLETLIFDEDGDYRQIFIRERTYVDRRLASIYDVRATAREGFGEVELSREGGRRGLLGQTSFLALYAHPVSSSATKRGAFVRRTLLCGEVLPPPVNVNTSLPEPTGTAVTLRDRVGEHLSNPACAGCHSAMDPIGLGLETFDGIGRFRLRDRGAAIDPSGELDGVRFADAWSLGQVIHDHPRVADCLVRNLYRYATGNVETEGEAQTIEQLTRKFQHSGHRVRPLMFEVAMSLGFRLAKPAEGGGS